MLFLFPVVYAWLVPSRLSLLVFGVEDGNGLFNEGMTGRKKGEGRVSPPVAFPSSPSAELKRFPSTMIINE